MIRRLIIFLLIVGCVFGQIDTTKTKEDIYKYFLETSGSTYFKIVDYDIVNDEITITKDGVNWEVYPITQIKRITDLNGVYIWENTDIIEKLKNRQDKKEYSNPFNKIFKEQVNIASDTIDYDIKKSEYNKSDNTWSIGIGLYSSKVYSLINVSKYFLIANNRIYLFAGIPAYGIGLENNIHNFTPKSSLHIGASISLMNPVIANSFKNMSASQSPTQTSIDFSNMYIISFLISYKLKLNHTLLTLGVAPSYFKNIPPFFNAPKIAILPLPIISLEYTF